MVFLVIGASQGHFVTPDFANLSLIFPQQNSWGYFLSLYLVISLFADIFQIRMAGSKGNNVVAGIEPRTSIVLRLQ